MDFSHFKVFYGLQVEEFNNNTFTLPTHTGDLPEGTSSKVIFSWISLMKLCCSMFSDWQFSIKNYSLFGRIFLEHSRHPPLPCPALPSSPLLSSLLLNTLKWEKSISEIHENITFEEVPSGNLVLEVTSVSWQSKGIVLEFLYLKTIKYFEMREIHKWNPWEYHFWGSSLRKLGFGGHQCELAKRRYCYWIPLPLNHKILWNERNP